jgi:archaeal flagellar protein FlaI
MSMAPPPPPPQDLLNSRAAVAPFRAVPRPAGSSAAAGLFAEVIDKYSIQINNILVDIIIETSAEEAVPLYKVSIANISPTTKIILEKIRQEFVSKMNLSDLEQFETAEEIVNIREQFRREIRALIIRYFPHTDEPTLNMLVNYLLEENLGLGKIEILLKDSGLEEIVVNNHTEPVWVYHRKHGWLKTNVLIPSEARIRHFATMIGREVGKEITNLNPLMDAHLSTGDRVNATLAPISNKGNTITIRKFAEDPWTITKFIREGTINFEAAAFIWLAIQNELSILISGGTGSGKTSMLNVVANFFPPNQRIISIEDTRELTLPKNLHWVPMETRLPNPEGKGGVTMLDLLVNSLRMRPDRIIVGEMRRKQEAEVLLEAMHTGHSVYATIHANNADEVVTRLTNPPIDIPRQMISSLSLILVQNRNRRTGKRRTLQVAEILPDGSPRVLMRYNAQKDLLEKIADSEVVLDRLQLYTGMSKEEIEFDLRQKVAILKWLVRKSLESVDEIGLHIAKYYTGQLTLD